MDSKIRIEITSPVFKCAEDRGIFFVRLREITGYESVTDLGSRISLTLMADTDDGHQEELDEICAMWNTDFKFLARE